MANLTRRSIPHHAYVCLGLCSLGIALLASACSDGSGGTSGSAGSTSTGGSGGSASGGVAGSASSAGSKNLGGSAGSSAGGSAPQAGSGGSGGASGGTGGTGGSAAGTGGSGGSGGMACAPTDKCCDDPNKTEPGMCGCGVPDFDDDNDGLLNCKEKCPLDPDKTEEGMCGCGTPDNDSDGDGIIDCKPGHFIEAEDGVLSQVDAPITPLDDGAGGAGGADGAGGAPPTFAEMFTVGEDAKASKGKYLESPAGFTADGLPGPARATYTFELKVAKKYVFWGRFYTPSRDHNRIWVKVDDGVWTKLRVTTGETWFWYTFHKEGEFDVPTQFDLAKGNHTLVIASDSDGVKVDRFYVTPGGDRPPGDATTCNPPHTIPVGDVCQSSCGMLQGNSCDPVMCAGKPALPAYDCDVCCTL